MNCEQKSGVFLNITCQNKIHNTCSVCDKKVCATHCYIWLNTDYCEDCYWEHYLLTIESRPSSKPIDMDNNTTSHSTTYSSSNSTSDSEGGFKDGFGGGEFGGAGATGTWTEGDMQSLADTTENPEGLLNDTDDTFFYS